MLTNCGRVPLDMIGGQCDKRVCDAPAAGLLRRRLPAPSIATHLIAASALYISAIGHFDHFLRQAAPGPALLGTYSRSPRGRAAVFAGWGARRGAPLTARLSTSGATPQTARKDHCPKGWSEIGRLNAPSNTFLSHSSCPPCTMAACKNNTPPLLHAWLRCWR